MHARGPSFLREHQFMTMWQPLRLIWAMPRLFTTTGTRSFSSFSIKPCRNLTKSTISNWSPLHPHQFHPKNIIRFLGGSPAVNGLNEFFPVTNNPIEEGERTGRPWLARDLRNKSSEDLHKLWYVLLKERNMLLTIKQEAKRELFVFPGPERMRKVRRSMARIKVVLFERERALKEVKEILKGPSEAAGKDTVRKLNTKEIRRQMSYKSRKLILKKRVKPIRDHKLWKRTETKRPNVRNYKHIKAVRELELKG